MGHQQGSRSWPVTVYISIPAILRQDISSRLEDTMKKILCAVLILLLATAGIAWATTTTTTNFGFPKPPLGTLGTADGYGTLMDSADTAVKTAIYSHGTIATIGTGGTIYPSSTGGSGGTKVQLFTVTALDNTGTTYFGQPAGGAAWADGDRLTIRILDNGTARVLDFTTSTYYTAVGTVLPTTTVLGKYLYVGCIYNSTTAKWDVVAVSQQ
jgi:hypothetical protein